MGRGIRGRASQGTKLWIRGAQIRTMKNNICDLMGSRHGLKNMDHKHRYIMND